MKAKAIFWQALTPIHPGTGQDSGSVIDLPVAREAATKFPIIPASSLKGVLRDGREDETSNKIFGSIEAAGELTLTDARILFLPVRSYAGTFALLTCPLVLQRLWRDQMALGLGMQRELPDVGQTQAVLTSSSKIQHSNQVILEDIDLEAQQGLDSLAKALSQAIFGSEEAYFIERLALVHNDVFSYFSETGMEVIARVKLKSDSKTVQDGGLWYEEAIPAEAIFSSFALSKTDDFAELNKTYIQIGGKASVGRGLLRKLEVKANG
ncbi:MAG: type III-B CRISPR module RAMP protein Cmr4 [Thermaceae bacterium]|nr:type III-B CRISPR module RAMP protein Cmr4 [Thermaceae bacterium]